MSLKTSQMDNMMMARRSANRSSPAFEKKELSKAAEYKKSTGMLARAAGMFMQSAKSSSHKKKRIVAESLQADEAAMEDEEMGEIGSEELLEQREAQRPYFQQMDSTKEYAETHYYGLKSKSDFAARVPLSLFWAELAESALSGSVSLLSPSVLHCTANLTTYVAALAFTDLPLQPCKHGFLSQNLGIRLKAASHFLAFHKSMDEAPSSLQESALCTQRFFNPADRYFSNAAGEQEERPVKEFLMGTVYGSQVIVTNMSVASLSAHVLAQVPEGAFDGIGGL